VLQVARWKYTMQKIAILAPLHNLSGYVVGTKACIDNGKKLVNSNTSSTCPDNMVNFSLLTAEICWRVWGTLANFNGLNRGRHLYSAGWPSRWALAHILVYFCNYTPQSFNFLYQITAYVNYRQTEINDFCSNVKTICLQ